MSKSPSNLERVFEFRDESFSEYIQARSRRSLSATTLAELSDNMHKVKHPMVRYAAGWAALELALYRPSRGNNASGMVEVLPTLDDRLSWLDRAEEYWEDGRDDFERLRRRTASESRRVDIMGFEHRADHALSYLPTMEVIAGMVHESPFDEDETDQRLQQTKDNVLTLGKQISHLPTKSSAIVGGYKRGIAAEIACGLVGQNEPSGTFRFLPSSVRQDNNVVESLRADLVAVSTTAPYLRTLIQVKTKMGYRSKNPFTQSSDQGIFKVYAERDLLSAPNTTVLKTLGDLRRLEEGAVAPETADTLQSMSRLFIEELCYFGINRVIKTQPPVEESPIETVAEAVSS